MNEQAAKQMLTQALKEAGFDSMGFFTEASQPHVLTAIVEVPVSFDLAELRDLMPEHVPTFLAGRLLQAIVHRERA